MVQGWGADQEARFTQGVVVQGWGADHTSRHLALETCLHLPQNRATVGAFTEPHDSEKHRLFERT